MIEFLPETVLTIDIIVAHIAISESSLLTAEPTPTAFAPAAKARGAVLGVIPDAVIIGREVC